MAERLYFLEWKTVKIWECEALSEHETCTQDPGTITAVAKDSFDVSCGKGILRVQELQLEGKKRMDTKSFLLGNPWKTGTRLGEYTNI